MTLSASEARAATAARLNDETFDILVVGGGITGAGVALDAAARGLRVALVERDDLGYGTSSRSSKLVHGGLRYLQQREFLLVRENLAERRRLLANAPHLVRPQEFLVPLFGDGGVADRAMARAMGLGLSLYDIAGGRHIGRWHHRVDRAEALRLVPALDPTRLASGAVYDDARADDARLVLAIVRTAQEFGAAILTHTAASELLHDASGRLRGARLDGGTEVRARVVVNAAGVWAEHVAALDGARLRLRPAKGVHLTFARSRIPCESAAVVSVPADGRGLFVIPWGNRVYVGTTDTDYDGPLDEPLCTTDDVDYVVAGLSSWLREPVTGDDVIGTWAGLRPLIADARTERTADISRRHTVTTSPSGLVSIIGGKLTTYRRMAADAVDAAVRVLGAAGRSRTANLCLRGAGDPAEIVASLRRSHPDMSTSTAEHLAGRYGTDAPAVAHLAESSTDLTLPLVPGLPYLRAEAVWAVREEMAATLSDVLDRRTRARLLDRGATAAAAPEVARLIAPELDWDAQRIDAEVEAYLAELRREAVAAGATLVAIADEGVAAAAG